MPYIPMDRRPQIDLGETPQNAGELNYALTMTVLRSSDSRSLHAKLLEKCTAYLADAELRYQRINDVIGALHGAASELSRRSRNPNAVIHGTQALQRVARILYFDVAGPYEDKAILKNGDISYE